METKNQFHRYGHMKDVLVKVGDIVKKGQKFGTVGTGNGAWLAHLHRDAPKKFPIVNGKPSYAFYNIGWTRQETLDFFTDPRPYGWAMPEYDHLGLGWLQYWNYGTEKAPKMCYHPGVDENGPGSGNADLGDDVEAVTDGVVVYCYDGLDKNGGWGKLLVIQETKEVPAIPESEIEHPVPVTVVPPVTPETPLATPILIPSQPVAPMSFWESFWEDFKVFLSNFIIKK